MKLLPQNIKVKFYGPLKSEHVNQTLQQNDILILPSLGENYGHIINEAFSVGTPVIISDKTPWTNLQKKKIGWSLSLKDETKFEKLETSYDEGKPNHYKKVTGSMCVCLSRRISISLILYGSPLQCSFLLALERFITILGGSTTA